MDITTIDNLQPCRTAAAIGYFDGVHPGHEAVIAAAVKRARELGVIASAATFSFEGFRPRGKGGQDLMQRSLCYERLRELGVRLVVELPMASIAGMAPEEFHSLLRDKICAESVFCGEDFRYGKDRSGDAARLKAAGESFGFEVKALPDVMFRGEPLSTSAIKERIAAGDVKRAAELLGRPYAFEAPVVEEKHLARRMGFPTANSRFPDIVKPKAGSYISRTVLPDGRRFFSVTNLGVRPTVGGSFFCSETHILDFSEDLRGSMLRVELLEFLRPEKRFDNIDRLRAAISADVAAAMLYAAKHS